MFAVKIIKVPTYNVIFVMQYFYEHHSFQFGGDYIRFIFSNNLIQCSDFFLLHFFFANDAHFR